MARLGFSEFAQSLRDVRQNAADMFNPAVAALNAQRAIESRQQSEAYVERVCQNIGVPALNAAIERPQLPPAPERRAI